MIGSTLSHYEITAELGRGGMGIVYRARDTKLNRDVALKILPAAALASEEDRARFFREAQAAAQLHHPNIATVFEIDEAILKDADGNEVNATDGPRPYIAMECISGETLQETIKKAPLKLADVVNITSQVAEALSAAHAKDIVHRDIKSANVMITEDGIAKVLDFGLAKTDASTMLTRMGSTLGTIAYMSPEQARGHEVDVRSDLYSLGTVMYEMISGKLPFEGEYEQAIVYGILNESPEHLTAVRTGVPMQLEWIVNKLLSKEADYRYQSAAGLLADLKTVDLGGSGKSMRSMPVASAAELSPITSPLTGRVMPTWGWAAIVVALILGAGGMWMLNSSGTTDSNTVIRTKLDVLDGPDPPFALAISGSGSLLAYSDRETVKVRNMTTDEEWEIQAAPGIERIVFSEDEDWLYMEAPGTIFRSQVRGGAPVTLASVSARFSTVNLAPENMIVYESAGNIWRQSLAGGDAAIIVARDSTKRLDDPHLTADAKTLLVLEDVVNSTVRIAVHDYPSGRRRGELNLPGTRPRYLESGHLLYTINGQMFAAPVDLESVEVLNAGVPLSNGFSYQAFSLTSDGHLFAARQTEVVGIGFANRRLTHVDWEGIETLLPPEVAFYVEMDLNTAGDEVVIEVIEGSLDIWVVNLNSGVRNRITFNNRGDDPYWHPLGDSLLYVEGAGGFANEIVVRSADGSGSENVIHRTEDGRIWRPRPSPDMKFVLFEFNSQETSQRDIWRLDVENGTTRAVISGEGHQQRPSYSPDGQFVVYQSPGSSGQRHIWMQPATFDENRWDISRGPGEEARWSPDGSAIYYSWRNELIRVDIETSQGSVSISNPVTVLSLDDPLLGWDLSPDGSGIVMVQAEPSVNINPTSATTVDGMIDVVFNWTSYLTDLIPVPD